MRFRRRLFNALLLGLLMMGITNARFDAIDKRFDDIQTFWRAEFRRVGGMLDARLKKLK